MTATLRPRRVTYPSSPDGRAFSRARPRSSRAALTANSDTYESYIMVASHEHPLVAAPMPSGHNRSRIPFGDGLPVLDEHPIVPTDPSGHLLAGVDGTAISPRRPALGW